LTLWYPLAVERDWLYQQSTKQLWFRTKFIRFREWQWNSAKDYVLCELSVDDQDEVESGVSDI